MSDRAVAHVRIVLNAAPGASRTLCGAPVGAWDLLRSDAERDLLWVTCADCARLLDAPAAANRR